MQIESFGFGDGVLTVKCSGIFGAGSEGTPSRRHPRLDPLSSCRTARAGRLAHLAVVFLAAEILSTAIHLGIGGPVRTAVAWAGMNAIAVAIAYSWTQSRARGGHHR